MHHRNPGEQLVAAVLRPEYGGRYGLRFGGGCFWGCGSGGLRKELAQFVFEFVGVPSRRSVEEALYEELVRVQPGEHRHALGVVPTAFQPLSYFVHLCLFWAKIGRIAGLCGDTAPVETSPA